MNPALKGIKTLKDLKVDGKIVFVRLDLNVPMDKSIITDDLRIRESIPTILELLKRGCKLVLASHLGRPKTKEDLQYSLEPVGRRVSELLAEAGHPVEVILFDDPEEDAIKSLIKVQKKNQILLLENLRFASGETKNKEELAQVWAGYAEAYVNDAFGASHRAHASIDALPKLIAEKGVGFLIEKEVQNQEAILFKPKRPFWLILGGAKVSDKLPLIEKFIDHADGFIVGGAMAYTFLKAKGIPVGKSLVENDMVKKAKEMLERMQVREKPFLLPIDHVAAESLEGNPVNINTESIPENLIGLDIGPKTRSQIEKAIHSAGCVFWNGPMGLFENSNFSEGTFAIAKSLAESKGLKFVGGGDSAAAAYQSGYADLMTHISTGGGASLEFLQGEKLPGLEALRSKNKSKEIPVSEA